MQVRPLKGFGSFDKVIRRGHKVFHRGIVAFVRLHPVSEPLRQAPAQQEKVIYLGATCKKRTRPAVMRNRIKRLLRHSMQHLCASGKLDAAFWQTFPLHEVVLVWTAIPQRAQLLRAAEVEKVVEAVLRKAAQKHVQARQTRNQSGPQFSRKNKGLQD